MRLRIDGVLHEVHLIPRMVYQAIVSRIKLLSGCNLAEKRRPQDGRIKREQGGREIELRVSTMPTAFGEKAVLRIFDPDILLKQVNQLGFSELELPLFFNFLSRTTGIILVTGPTGSGKTTTLYSALKFLAKPEVNIVTIEDPIEMVHEEFNQVAVRPQIEVTFANALRTVLRQDPDIIMVGEIRDTETAEYAVQAALTGHLVLSTLHTNDAPSSITRLLDLKVPGFLISSTVLGILAQRLVRVICTHCAEEYAPTHTRNRWPEYPVRRALAAHAQERTRLPALPADGIQRPRRHIRDPSHYRHHTPPDLGAGRQRQAVRRGARGRHADAARSGHRESAERHHDRQRNGPRDREIGVDNDSASIPEGVTARDCSHRAQLRGHRACRRGRHHPLRQPGDGAHARAAHHGRHQREPAPMGP